MSKQTLPYLENNNSDRLLGLKEGDHFEHFKGGRYKILDFINDSTTVGIIVVYQNLENGCKWGRPIEEFSSLVDGKPRFKKIQITKEGKR